MEKIHQRSNKQKSMQRTRRNRNKRKIFRWNDYKEKIH